MTRIIYYVYLIKYIFNILLSEKDTKKEALFCLLRHHKVRQSYDRYPYWYHLNKVSKMTERFSRLINNPIEAKIVAYGHDLIEDTRLTFNDIVKLFGIRIANSIYACTELRGKNRNERHGPEYYKLLKQDELGRFVKLCDIAANMERGLETGSSMLNKYINELPHIKKELITGPDDPFIPIFNHLENIASQKK